LTKAEFDALADADVHRVVSLARSPESNLHLFFTWDDDEAAQLQRHRRMHGDGN
jgi:hypothetical protein